MPLKQFGAKTPIRFILGIASGKGGVGKSTFTVTLAHALNASGYKVGVLDADLYGPSIRTMLPEDQAPHEIQDRIAPAYSNGIGVISMAFFKSREEASLIRAPIACKLIAQFLHKVEWGPLDYLLIDFPPGTGDIQIALSQEAQLTGALIVTTPQEIALIDVEKCISMFRQVHVPIIGIAENMSYYQPDLQREKTFIFGQGGGVKLAQAAQVPFLGETPLIPAIRQSLDEGRSPLEASPDIKKHFLKLSADLNQLLSHGEIEGLSSFEIIWKELPKRSQLSQNVLPSTTSSNNPLGIRSIRQTDNHTFAIEWVDGSYIHYPLAELQKRCPCAGCQNSTRLLDPEVRAIKIRNVGRYGLQIDFTRGCSHGIYDWEMLHQLKNHEAKL